MIDPEKLLPCRLCGSLCSEQYFPSIQGTLWACSNSVRLGGICEAAFATSEEAWNTPQPPTPYGKVHTDGSRSGGMPPGTNAQPPAATPGTDGKNGTAPANPMGQPPAQQDDLPTAFEAWWETSDWRNKLADNYRLRKCLAFAAYEAAANPIIAERDAALAELEQTFYDRDERIGELRAKLGRVEHDLTVTGARYDAVTAKLAAAEAREGVLRLALTECADDLDAEIEAKRGTVLARTTERDLAPVRKARAALATEKPE